MFVYYCLKIKYETVNMAAKLQIYLQVTIYEDI